MVNPTPRYFFDWDYAVQVWSGYDTRKELIETYKTLCRDIHPSPTWFKNWSKYLKHPDDRWYALEMLENQPNAEIIKKCYDVRLVTEQYDKILKSYGQDLKYMGRRDRWNRITSPQLCKEIRHLNIFTRDCNDIPDWRTDEERARHEEYLTRNDAAHEEETRKSADE